MRKKDIDKIVATIGVITLGLTPPVRAVAKNEPLVIEDITKAKSVETVFLTSYDRINQIEQEGLRIKKEREEAEKIRLLEEERLRKEEEERAIIEEENRKNNVGVDLDNVLEISNIKAEELYDVLIFLEKEEMAELSWAFVDAERITGINALFLVGLAAQESAWGTSYRAMSQNNLTGYAVYNSKAEGSSFDSKYDCILQTAEWLRKEYLSEDGAYFEGYTTFHINLNYCFDETGSYPDMNWSKNINNIAKTIESIYFKFIM